MKKNLEKLLQFISQSEKKKKAKPRDLAKVLDMRMDSVYRRLRGEVEFNLSELEMLSKHYKISLDAVLFDAEGSASFQFNQLFSGSGNLFQYIRRMNELLQATQRQQGILTYVNTDIPLPYTFGNQLIRRFKGFYWQKVLFNANEFKTSRFGANFRLDPRLEAEMDTLAQTYRQVKRTEIWSDNSVNNTLRQVKYCKNIGLFENHEIQEEIKEALMQIVTQIEEELADAAYSPELNHTQLYLSSIELGNNCVQFELGETIYTFIGFANFNSLVSTNHPFGLENKLWIQAVKAKSVLLTGQSEVIRHQFFEGIRKQIAEI